MRTARNRTVANKEVRGRVGTVLEEATKTVAALEDTDPTKTTGMEDSNVDPCNNSPPHTVWMGMQACGVEDVAAAKSLVRNLSCDERV